MYRWPATYFDGASAVRQPVTVGHTAEGIAFSLPDGRVTAWSSREYDLHVAPGRSHLRFERRPYRGEAIQVDDPAAITALLASNSLGVWRMSRIAVLAAVCLAVVVALYLSMPVITAAAARLLPRGVEERLGRVVVAGLVPESQRLALAEDARPILDRVFASADPAWKYEVTWQRTYDINALAAPGGQLVVFCGLVQAMQTPDELAAILAHEVTHVSERHSTRNMLRTMGARMALSLFGGADILVDSAAMLGALHYMRADEEVADAKGQELLLRAGIDPRSMASAFEHLDRQGIAVPAYLSSHPSTAERRKRASEFAGAHPGSYFPVMPDAQWRSLQKACLTQ